MKTTQTCPKCQSKDVMRIPGSIGGYGAGNNIPLGRTIFGGFVKVTRFLCGACGFSEEWIDDAADLARVKAKFGTGSAH